jgi:peptide/nickel transport system permease protein
VRRRALLALLTIWAAMTFTFVLLRLMPGDILHAFAQQIVNTHGVSYDQARELAKTLTNYDPDQPMLPQYLLYVSHLAIGDLGVSLTYRIPVSTIIVSALPWTLFITALSTSVSFCLGTALGLWAVWSRKGILDPLLTFYATVTQAVPDFLLGVLLLMIFGVHLQWLPLRGAYGPEADPGWNLAFGWQLLQHATLPVLAFSLPAIGSWALNARASATSVLGEEYVQVARAKGLRPSRILRDYLGRNALFPLLPGLATTLGGLLGGSMLIETLFGYPGVGYFLAQAIGTRDYTLMQGLFLLSTVAVVLSNLAAEALAQRLDPRLSR